MLLRFDSRYFVPAAQTRSAIPMDAYRHDGQLVLHFDMPGIDPTTIDLTVEKNMLTVSAERHYAKAEGDVIFVAERPQGRFSRQVRLSDSFDVDGIEAGFENGVLTLSIPVSQKAKARKITVSTTGAPAIEAETEAEAA
jgi:HSP20 family protein